METSRNNNLLYILHTLIEESPIYRSLEIPEDMVGRQKIMRTLLNIRPPRPISREFLAAQDAELQLQLAEKGVVTVSQTESCGCDERVRLWQGDITRLQVDAIVNAANDALLGCFVPLHKCIDNAIHSAAGIELRLECNRLMQKQGYAEPTGKAKITKGYNLPARYVIHTVGPIVSGGVPSPKQEKLLSDCYRSCLETATIHAVENMAFCCISTGEYGFPQQRAAEIAVATVLDYLNTTKYTTIKTIVFDVFSRNDYTIYRNLLQ